MKNEFYPEGTDNIMTKNELLQTGYFLDNSFLDEYLNLVNIRNIKKEPFKTQTHHILPKTYFKYMHMQIDNSANNLVELLYKDHVKAHYLLQQCTTDFLKRNNGFALRYLLSKQNIIRYNSTLTEADFEVLQELYEKSIITVEKEKFVDYYLTHTCKETAAYFKINLNTVTKLATEYDCLKNKQKHINKHVRLDKNLLVDYYITQNHTIADTARYFKVNKTTIIRKLKLYGLSQKKHHYRHELRSNYAKNINDIEEFKLFYKNHNRAETALHFNLSDSRVKQLVKDYGLSKVKNYNAKEIYDYFLIFGKNQTMQTYGISQTHFYRIINNEKGKENDTNKS